MFFGFREKKGNSKRKRNTDVSKKHWWVAFLMRPYQGLNHNLGMCPFHGLNQQPFGVWNKAPTWPGQGKTSWVLYPRPMNYMIFCYSWNEQGLLPVICKHWKLFPLILPSGFSWADSSHKMHWSVLRWRLKGDPLQTSRVLALYYCYLLLVCSFSSSLIVDLDSHVRLLNSGDWLLDSSWVLHLCAITWKHSLAVS